MGSSPLFRKQQVEHGIVRYGAKWLEMSRSSSAPGRLFSCAFGEREEQTRERTCQPVTRQCDEVH